MEPSYPFEPFHSATNSDKITTRWLDNPYAFNLTAIEPNPVQPEQQLQQSGEQPQPPGLEVVLSKDIIIGSGVLLDRMDAS